MKWIIILLIAGSILSIGYGVMGMEEEEIETSVPKIVALQAIRVYQDLISPAMREDKCNFTPSCSRYSVESIRKFGPVKGIVMTFDRVSRCHRWAWGYDYERRSGKLYDPPENNDFW